MADMQVELKVKDLDSVKRSFALLQSELWAIRARMFGVRQLLRAMPSKLFPHDHASYLVLRSAVDDVLKVAEVPEEHLYKGEDADGSVNARTNEPPESERKLTRNRAKCLECDDIIESKHRHDYRACSCGKLTVDGGLDYTKRGFSGKWEELSEYEDDPT